MLNNDLLKTIGSLVSLKDLARELHIEGEPSFRDAHPHPFLLLVRLPASNEEWIDPQTVEEQNPGSDPEEGKVRREFVLPLIKSGRNHVDNKVTIGRAKNNDIILRAPKVSKLHASFAVLGPDRYTLTDMESVNGTWYNGIRLPPREPRPVSNGDRIDLWRYGFEFLDLAGLIRLLRGKS